MAFTERELFETLAQLLDDRLKYIATKTDLTEVKIPLEEHLRQHRSSKAMWVKVKIAAIGSVLAGAVSMFYAWVS